MIRVLSEGEVTEPDYLFHMVGTNVVLDTKETGISPKSLVDRAWGHVKKNRKRRSQQDFDEIWCVFDQDNHHDIPGTLQTARDRQISVAFSNPCFELWLVLHVTDQTAYIERNEIQKRCEQLGLTRGKNIVPDAFDQLQHGYTEAKRRARSLDRMHKVNGSPDKSNPSSDVWRLVDRLRR